MMHEIELPHHGAGRLQGSALSSICQRLLDAEMQRGLAEGRDYSINLQVDTVLFDCRKRRPESIVTSTKDALVQGFKGRHG